MRGKAAAVHSDTARPPPTHASVCACLTCACLTCVCRHADCVEYLVTNGADPLLTDERRHNTCLHFASLYGHSECVNKLLGSRATYRLQVRPSGQACTTPRHAMPLHAAWTWPGRGRGRVDVGARSAWYVCVGIRACLPLLLQGRQVPVAAIPCPGAGVDAHGDPIKLVDRHNGWGLSALHVAVFQGSVSTGEGRCGAMAAGQPRANTRSAPRTCQHTPRCLTTHACTPPAQ